MKKLLAANRSEIAVRIFRSATELACRTVAVYANEDRFGVHRFKADESYLVGEGKGPVAAYLDIDSVIDIAKANKVDLVHPGYGFLSENAAFANACEANGLNFVGPSSDLLARMGDKIEARKIAEKANVPTLPGTEDPIADPSQALKIAKRIGFPLIIKAAFGGGIDWKTSAGEDRLRRGIYTNWRRSNPYPSMATFDAPNREVCTVRRGTTNTPLQALVTLNDPVYVEAAQSLARIMAKSSTSLEKQISTGFEICLAREPQDAELKRLVTLFNQVKNRYVKDADLARKMATDPIGPVPKDCNIVDLAALTVTGNVLLNLDEMMMKR